MTTAAEFRDLLHTPYATGGRQVGVELDCLGVVGEIARRRGALPPDGWESIRIAIADGTLSAASGFPPGWKRQGDEVEIRDGDVLVYYGAHPWCAIVHGGYVWSASAKFRHPYRLPAHRWTKVPDEVWRWAP